jgi:hypothetical protein
VWLCRSVIVVCDDEWRTVEVRAGAHYTGLQSVTTRLERRGVLSTIQIVCDKKPLSVLDIRLLKVRFTRRPPDNEEQ